ncbi:MAG: molybdopterin-dependent oxidoreductase, partial [Acidimicrobiales bacterium]
AQDGVLEFLLINHPLDCPVCDKGGECPLQDQTVAFGPGETRFVEEKRHWEKPIALSDLVLIDRERCIQCDRCTRFADEVAGDPLIEFIGRGASIEVNTFPDQPFSSYFSGNTVQVCPVGALLAVPYRFKARPWDLEQVESTCTTCSVGCRVAVQSSQDEITRLLGIDVDPVNHGWLCDKGRFAYEATNSQARLDQPCTRTGGHLREVSWGEALDAAAEAISAAGPDRVGIIGGAQLANEDAYAWARLAKGVIGTDNVDAQLGDGLPAEVVLGLPRATIDDACNAAAVLLLAPDLKEELPVLYLRLRGAALGPDRLPIIELTPKPTGLSKLALTLAYRPGEVGDVARGLAGDTKGDLGGVDPSLIAGVRDIIADADIVVVLCRPSVAESAASIVDAAATIAKAFPRARFLSALRRGNVHGALDMGLAPGMLPGRVTLDEGGAWFADAWSRTPAARGLDTAAMLAAAADGRVQTLVLLGADPLTDFPDRDLARRALDAATVIAVDCFETASVGCADVVLPAAAFAERGGTTTNLEGRISRLGPKVTAPGVAWPDWMIAVDLASRLGSDLGFASLEDIWDEIERLAPAHAGVTRAVVGSREARDGILLPYAGGELHAAVQTDTGTGSTVPVGGDAIDPAATPGLAATESQGVPATGTAPDADASAEESNAVAVARPPLVRFDQQPAPTSPPAHDAYSLRLVAGRRLYDLGTATQKSPSLAGLVAAPVLTVHPSDLERLGVSSGGQVRLKTARVDALVDVVAEPGMPRGSAWLPFNLPGVEVAEMIDINAPVNEIRIESP